MNNSYRLILTKYFFTIVLTFLLVSCSESDDRRRNSANLVNADSSHNAIQKKPELDTSDGFFMAFKAGMKKETAYELVKHYQQNGKIINGSHILLAIKSPQGEIKDLELKLLMIFGGPGYSKEQLSGIELISLGNEVTPEDAIYEVDSAYRKSHSFFSENNRGRQQIYKVPEPKVSESIHYLKKDVKNKELFFYSLSNLIRKQNGCASTNPVIRKGKGLVRIWKCIAPNGNNFEMFIHWNLDIMESEKYERHMSGRVVNINELLGDNGGRTFRSENLKSMKRIEAAIKPMNRVPLMFIRITPEPPEDVLKRRQERAVKDKKQREMSDSLNLLREKETKELF